MAKKQRAFEAIEAAIQQAKAQGIEIERGPMFDWSDMPPSSCHKCAYGSAIQDMGHPDQWRCGHAHAQETTYAEPFSPGEPPPWWCPRRVPLPRAVDATGAVLLSMGYGKLVLRYNGLEHVYGAGRERSEGWVSEVCKHLGVTPWWLRCFWLGWQGHQVYNPETNDKGIIVGWKEDTVSKEAMKMAKRLARW